MPRVIEPMGFDHRPGQIGLVLPTACHGCDTFSEMRYLQTKPHRLTPLLVTSFFVIPRVERRFYLINAPLTINVFCTF